MKECCCLRPTFNPTLPPTRPPTGSPTYPPHPCINNTHNCDLSTTVCAVLDAAALTYQCVCKQGFVQPTAAPTTQCVATTSPTTSPTFAPTNLPTPQPTTLVPTAQPTYNPTQFPTYHICNTSNHGCDLLTQVCAAVGPSGWTCVCRGGYLPIPGNAFLCQITDSPTTVAPTTTPRPRTTTTTPAPSANPTMLPTYHACTDPTRGGCDLLTTYCAQRPDIGPANFSCVCRPGYMPLAGSLTACQLTPPPTSTPTTYAPTVMPTMQPSLHPCVDASRGGCDLITTYCAHRPDLGPAGYSCVCRPEYVPIPTVSDRCAPSESPTLAPTLVAAGSTGGSSSGPSVNWWMLLAVVLFVILIVGVLVVLYRRKSDGAEGGELRTVAFNNPL